MLLTKINRASCRLSHTNNPQDIIYFPLPPWKGLKEEERFHSVPWHQKTPPRRAANVIQQRKSTLKPSLFYVSDCVHQRGLFHVQVGQPRSQPWLHATTKQLPSFAWLSMLPPPQTQGNLLILVQSRGELNPHRWKKETARQAELVGHGSEAHVERRRR